MMTLLKPVKKQKVVLQTVVTVILAFVIASVFTFIEISISSYALRLLSNVL